MPIHSIKIDTICLDDFDLSVDSAFVIGSKPVQKAIKRAFDLAFSSLMLVVTSPVMAVACLAIVLESEGSPVFVQERSGLMGMPFRAYKLRTMYRDSSIGNLAAPKSGDPRVTKVGHFLRRTSIDELPQFLNILKGEMSIIGPRAVPSRELELRIDKMMQIDPSKEASYRAAMKVRGYIKPGLSGMAQAYGRSGLPVGKGTVLDVFYVFNFSLPLDVAIFFETIKTVLLQRGVN